MVDKTNAQTLGKRDIVACLDREFSRLHQQSCALIAATSIDVLYAFPEQIESSVSRQLPPIGESVLRGAAAIEQTFGGITANLWDDPFEWTLPEYLSTPAKVRAHLGEVEATRKRAFISFAVDDCLLKRVAVPSGETRPLIDLLLETLLNAAAFQAQAQIVLKILSGISPPGFII
ncbi:MAG: hypothetical protein ACRD9S_03940 [Pyrinomonadaceae bacterium]